MDNGLDQLAIAGWKMVMLGDDTWLKLFPDKFMRRDGVNSFYVRTCVLRTCSYLLPPAVFVACNLRRLFMFLLSGTFTLLKLLSTSI